MYGIGYFDAKHFGKMLCLVIEDSVDTAGDAKEKNLEKKNET